MKAEQLNEFNKKDFQKNEAHNLHSENAVEIAKAFGTPEEVEAMQRIMDQHMRRGHILPNEIEERNALVRKYYSMLEHSVNPTLRSTLEGYKVLPPMDKEKYQERNGLEGPFSTLSGKVVYYDPKAGKYYDPDTDMYISYDDFQKLDNDYSGIGDEEADDLINDIEPKETVKGPRGHLRSIVADDLNEIDCWDGYRKDGTKPGTGKNKGKRVNNCVKKEAEEHVDEGMPEMAPVYPNIKSGVNDAYNTIDEIDYAIARLQKTIAEEYGDDIPEGYQEPLDFIIDVMHKKLPSALRHIADISKDDEVYESINEDLRAWFGKGKKGGAGGGGWDRYNTKGERVNNCVKKEAEEHVDEGKYVSDAQRKAVHASKAEKK